MEIPSCWARAHGNDLMKSRQLQISEGQTTCYVKRIIGPYMLGFLSFPPSQMSGGWIWIRITAAESVRAKAAISEKTNKQSRSTKANNMINISCTFVFKLARFLWFD